MQDRPDLIQSELAGLSFDSTQELFRASHLENMFSMVGPIPPINSDLMLFCDPACGGPSSDYGLLSICRHQGVIMVSAHTNTGEQAPDVFGNGTETGDCFGSTVPPLPSATQGEYWVHFEGERLLSFIGFQLMR